MGHFTDLKGIASKILKLGKVGHTIDGQAATADRNTYLPDSNVDLRSGVVGQILAQTGANTVGWLDNYSEALVTNAFNDTGSTINKGQVVYFNGRQGDRPKAILAQANNIATSEKTAGLAYETAATGLDIRVVENGLVKGLNTDVVGWTEGDILWLDAATPGGITNVEPTGANFAFEIGILVRKHVNEGIILVRIDEVYKLSRLQDVSISTPANNQVLTYDSTLLAWKNAAAPTPANWNVQGTAAAPAVQISSGRALATIPIPSTSDQLVYIGRTAGTLTLDITDGTIAANTWTGVCWSPERELFVAVADSGTGTRVATSPNGTTWTSRTSASDNNWRGVCWSKEIGLFVAVAQSGTATRVMTSPDGITWTTRTSASDSSWQAVCWSPERRLFVAVGTNAVMTSPDGLAWTTRTAASGDTWCSVCWSPQLGMFMAVANTGAGGTFRTMRSFDGFSWTGGNFSITGRVCNGVCWAPELGLFAAVMGNGTSTVGFEVSSDGVNWTVRSLGSSVGHADVTWCPERRLLIGTKQNSSGFIGSPGVTISSFGTTATEASTFGSTARMEINFKGSAAWSPELGVLVQIGQHAGVGTARIIQPITLNASPINDGLRDGQILRIINMPQNGAKNNAQSNSPQAIIIEEAGNIFITRKNPYSAIMLTQGTYIDFIWSTLNNNSRWHLVSEVK